MRLPEIYEHSVTRTGIVTYGIELEHLGLKKHRVIKDRDLDILERRATLQLEQWEEQWAKKQARQAAADARAAAQSEKEQAQREAQGPNRCGAAAISGDREYSALYAHSR